VRVKPGDNIFRNHGPVLFVLEEQVARLVILDYRFVYDIGRLVPRFDRLVADFFFATSHVHHERSGDFSQNLLPQHMQLLLILHDRMRRNIRPLTQWIAFLPVGPPLGRRGMLLPRYLVGGHDHVDQLQEGQFSFELAGVVQAQVGCD